MINLDTLKVDDYANVTFFEKDGYWVKQMYDGFVIINYEDSDGIYWDINLIVPFPYREFRISKHVSKYIIEGDILNSDKLYLNYEHNNVVEIDTRYLFIKHIHPMTMASTLVPVAPMDGPTGNLHYIDCVYNGDALTQAVDDYMVGLDNDIDTVV